MRVWAVDVEQSACGTRAQCVIQPGANAQTTDRTRRERALPTVRDACMYVHAWRVWCEAWCSVQDFEFTPELQLFDLFNITLFHGWVLDPQVSCAVFMRNTAVCGYRPCLTGGRGSLRH